MIAMIMAALTDLVKAMQTARDRGILTSVRVMDIRTASRSLLAQR